MELTVHYYHWIGFSVLIFALISLDLWHFNRHPHKIGMKEAIFTTIGWIAISLLFNLWIFFQFGKEPAILFFTGYLLEKSLSIDNIFLIILIFSHFKPPPETKHEVLFYGVLGAIIMRALLILGGIALVKYFSWTFYIFGAFLIYTGFKLFFQKEEKQIIVEENIAYRLLSKYIPMVHTYHNGFFLIKKDGTYYGTPLLVVLVLIEFTDLLFAIDSVPAILGITTDPFLVFTSNIFAILGLRSLFFVLEDAMEKFDLLHYSLSFILVFIGFKMLVGHWIPIPSSLTIGIVLFFLLIALIGSFIFPKKKS